VNLLAADQLAIGSAWAVYIVGAIFVIGGAGGVVLLSNPVHCALSLVTTIFGIALLFVDQGANFLAAVQIIVYGGAVVILFLFVIMLLGVDRKEPRRHTGARALTPVAVLVGVVAVVELLVLARAHYWATGQPSALESITGPGNDVQKLGQTVFTGYLLPFEMTSALLVIAVVAAVVLVRRSAEPAQEPPRRAGAANRTSTKAPGGPDAMTEREVPRLAGAQSAPGGAHAPGAPQSARTAEAAGQAQGPVTGKGSGPVHAPGGVGQ